MTADEYHNMLRSMGVVDLMPKNVTFGTSPVLAVSIPQYDVQHRHTQHFDWVDGCPWEEVSEFLPLVQNEYSTSPIFVFFSNPCKVKTKDGFSTAVYVSATDGMPNNDGTRCHWEGWIEMPEKSDDWLFIENIFKGKTIDVVRWHYIKK